MNIERKASHVLTCGKSGQGKSTYNLRYIIGSHHDRVFIFDHQGEYQLRLPAQPCYDFDQLRERAKTERILVFDYSKFFEGRMEESFDQFCDEVFSMCKYHLEPQGVESLCVCDELQKIVSTADCPKPLKNIVQTGRRFNLDTALMSQQPNRLHNEVREQVTELVMFNLIDENSLKFVKKMGLDEQPIIKLQPLHYIWYDLQRGISRPGVIDYAKKSG